MLLLFPMQIVCMDAEVEADIEEMIFLCHKKCYPLNGVKQSLCATDCFSNYARLRRNFVTRKSTQECLGLRFDERWSFNKGNERVDLENTFHAIDRWNDLAIANCARGRISLYEDAVRRSLEKREFKQAYPITLAKE